MKKLFILCAVSSVLLSSCKKAKIDVDFDLNLADVYFTIDTTSVTGDVLLSSAIINSTLQQELESHDADLDDVQSIVVSDVEFTHLNPQNFDIVDRAYAYISVPGEVDQRIGHKDPVPAGTTFIQMELDAVNLKNYLAVPTLTLKLTGHLNSPNIEADSLKAHLVFTVNASVAP